MDFMTGAHPCRIFPTLSWSPLLTRVSLRPVYFPLKFEGKTSMVSHNCTNVYYICWTFRDEWDLPHRPLVEKCGRKGDAQKT
uniref:Uncharacterized protein n=1 Tax=Peronospora matthiolae TaxID=2874970 RepID=A0AAV1T5X5_9STRA